MYNTNPVRGTRDFLPEEMALRAYMKKTIVEVYQQHGFNEIQTPAIENIDLLLSSEGGENLKLIYKILKRGRKLKLDIENLGEGDLVDLSLRYDLTLPLSRFYAHYASQLPKPFKSMQIGDVYRAERPQKGRYRSLVQCDIDIIGDKDNMAEIELIAATAKALMALTFRNFTIRINDRRLLKKVIGYAGFDDQVIGNVCVIFDKLDKIGIKGVSEELKNKGYDVDVVNRFVTIVTKMDKMALSDFGSMGVDEKVLSSLQDVLWIIKEQSKGQYAIKFDPSLVRGMGYYTGMIYEIACDELGCSIAGGGRYNNMIGRFMKENVPAVGFSIGFERIFEILKDKGYQIPDQQKKVALLYGEENRIEIFEEADRLRAEGMLVSLIPRHKKLGKQCNRLKEQNFNYYGYWSDDAWRINALY
ncbi:histidine--tRNA ligase [Vallitalea pronyensis]|uniref:Histidine--tRNA ligase n=1 Tax=Vallitalea pronyensis TaxID=1348613 RepID=A0A8J8MGM8_9FIRM|nr:histidine--tRNA ligase [Vallitalea pronyensis]QUI21240.1 histidine--tRNA ligase [Vallitalea pronyensis]